MIAITVILAAVIGTFALGFGHGAQDTSQTSFDFEFGQADIYVASLARVWCT